MITLLLNASFIKWYIIFLLGIQEHNIYQICLSLERLVFAVEKFHMDQRLQVQIISSYILLFFKVIQRNNIRFLSKQCFSMILGLNIYIIEKKTILIRISKDWMIYTKLLGEICYSVDYHGCIYSCLFICLKEITQYIISQKAVFTMTYIFFLNSFHAALTISSFNRIDFFMSTSTRIALWYYDKCYIYCSWVYTGTEIPLHR